jgi:hypothetical protein
VIEPSNRDIDVDQLMAEIRDEVLRARAATAATAAATAAPAATTLPAPVANDASWYSLRDHLHVAEQHAAVGAEVPPFGRYSGPKRLLARSLARIVIFLSQVITMPQRTYNGATLGAIRLLGERVQALESEVAALRASQARAPRGPAAAPQDPSDA